MTILIIQGGHQEDAEEFFGFYLDTLEEELLAKLAAVSSVYSTNTSSTNTVLRKNGKPGSVTSTTNAATSNSELESVVSHEDANGDGWLEVGKRNRTVVTRMVCRLFSVLLCRVFQYFIALLFPSSPLSLLPSTLAYFVAYFLAHLLVC